MIKEKKKDLKTRCSCYWGGWKIGLNTLNSFISDKSMPLACQISKEFRNHCFWFTYEEVKSEEQEKTQMWVCIKLNPHDQNVDQES